MARKVFCCLALAILCGAQSAFAAIAYNTADLTGNQSWTGNLGLDFDVLSPITVSRLGAYDSGQDGFPGRTVTVQIWDRTGTPTLLASTTFTDTEGSVVGAYRFKTPDGGAFTLGPGSYSVMAQGFDSPNPNGNENIPTFTVSTDDGGGLVDFVGTGRWDTSTTPGFAPLTGADQGFPSLTPHVFAAGSFEFAAAVPEAASVICWLTLIGLAAGAARWRRRGSQA